MMHDDVKREDGAQTIEAIVTPLDERGREGGHAFLVFISEAITETASIPPTMKRDNSVGMGTKCSPTILAPMKMRTKESPVWR